MITVGTMKSVLTALTIIATIWCYPLAAEDTIDPCGALASQAMHIESGPDQGGSGHVTLIRSFGDFVVSENARQRHPSIPSGLVCIGYYWRLVADPDFVGAIRSPNDTDGMIDRRVGAASGANGGASWTTRGSAAP